MQPQKPLPALAGRTQWSSERIGRLDTGDIEQLRANAQKLGEVEVVALCDQALAARPRGGGRRAAPAPRRLARALTSRTKAFRARGVDMADGPGSWSGVRASDGMVVISLWASAVVSRDGACRHLLWAPNIDGARPWSDTPAGQARLEHCKRALKHGKAEGLLVHGELLEGHLPEDRARSIHGVDPELVVMLKVEQRGEEYWAVWGGRAADRPA